MASVLSPSAASAADPMLKLMATRTGARNWADEDEEDTDVEVTHATVSQQRAPRSVERKAPTDSRDSSIASLRSTSNAIKRRRNRGGRGGKQNPVRASDELSSALELQQAAQESLGSAMEPLPLTRSAASELALLLGEL